MRKSWIAALGLALLGATASAQAPAFRRELATPGLVVETGMRTGALDVLRFSPDGNYLLATGDDKVVRTWKLVGGKLEAIPAAAAEPRSVLRWPSMRELRGNIYALAVSPVDKNRHVAVGGVGLKDSQLAILNRFTGAIDAILPIVDEKQGGFGIASIAYSPSGSYLVCGGDNGAIWKWDGNAKTGTLLGVSPHPEKKPFGNEVRLLHFLDENRLLSGDRFGRILLWQDGAAREVARLGPVEVWRYAASDTKLVAGLKTNRVVVLHLDQENRLESIDLPSSHVPSALALDPKTGRLAIATSQVDLKATFHKEIGQKTFIVDLKAPRPTLEAGPSGTYRIEALAFHPTLDLLAMGGGDHHEITLWKKGEGWEKVSHLESPGRCFYGIKLSADGERLYFQEERHADAPHPNERGRGAWKAFDLMERKFLDTVSAPKDAPENKSEAGGWRVLTSRSAHWSVHNPHTGEANPLPWDFNKYGHPLCYSFLPDIEKGKIHLVVGHLNGASVFELTRSGPRRVKFLIGHDGEVYCLAVAHTKRGVLLVTAGRDQTIAGWSLAPWKTHPLLGAELIPQDGKLIVGEVDALSPGWEVGLSKGDEIAGLWLSGRAEEPAYLPGGVNFLTGRRVGPVGAANDAVAALDQHAAGETIVLFWTRSGHKGVMGEKTTLKERPVWRFFPTRDQEWVLWRVNDYFYDCSTNGDRYVGWHLNSFGSKGYDVYATPRFYPAERMRKLYHQPEKVSQALASWSRREAIYQTGKVGEKAPAGGDVVALERLAVVPSPGDQVRFVNHDTLYQVDKGSTRSQLRLSKALTAHVPPGTAVEFLGLMSFQNLEPPVVQADLLGGGAIKDTNPALAIRIKPRSGRENQRLTRIQIWINDFLFQRLEGDDLKLREGMDDAGEPVFFFEEKELTIPRSLLRSGKNRILVQAFNRSDFRAESTPLFVTLERPRVEATLHGVFIGIGDYSKALPPQRALGADQDAEALARVLEEYAGKSYKKKNFIVLTNGKATPDAILERLDSLAKAHPDDVLLFHLGGHGINVKTMENQYEVALAAEAGDAKKRSILKRDLDLFREKTRGLSEFLFICGHFQLDRVKESTLELDKLYERLVRIPCQKVVILDACHSGGVTPPSDGLGKIFLPEAWNIESRKGNDLIRMLTPDQVGPIIFTSCSPQEAALEIRGLTNVDKMFGLFSQALVETIVEGFDKADVNKNGGLDSKELGDHMTKLINQFLLDFPKRNPMFADRKYQQTPQLYLPDLSRDFVLVRPPE